jgi:hypothetical protein
VSSILFAVTEDSVVATVIPVRDMLGDASVTIFVSDGTTKVGRPFLFRVINPPNDPPTLGSIADQTTFKNVPAFVRLNITDPDTAVSDLTITAVAANTTLVQSAIAALGTDGSVILNIRPRADQTGQSSIQVTVNDGANTVTASFILTVSEPPNDPPVLGAIADQNTDVNKSINLSLSVSDPDTAVADLTFSSTVSNPSVIRLVGFSNDGTNVRGLITPQTDAAGVSTVTISVSDGKTTVSQTFAVNVKSAAPPRISQPTTTTNPDGTTVISIAWENGGELETAPSASGPWTKTGNTSGFYSETVAAGSVKFFRISRAL